MERGIRDDGNGATDDAVIVMNDKTKPSGTEPASSARAAVLAPMAAGARGVLRRAWFEASLRHGRDMTEQSAGRACVVLAPHPDDETLGCGAAIRRKRANGARVRVVIATDGRRSHGSDRITPDRLAAVRRAESFAACAALGVPEDDVVHLDYEDCTLDAHLDELSERIGRVLDEADDADVLVPSRLDDHADHRALNRALRMAMAATAGKRRAAEYTIGTPGPAAAWLLLFGGLEPDHGAPATIRARTLAHRLRTFRPELVATGPYLAAKKAALDCYRSQTSELEGEPAWSPSLDARAVAKFLQAYEVFFPL